MSTTTETIQQLPATINTEDVLRWFNALGHEMQGIQAGHRDRTFARLRKLQAGFGEAPTPQALAISAFMAGWLDYP